MSHISVVVPCYNERENVESTCRKLIDTLHIIDSTFEIILVDNGGTDGQLEVMKKVHLENVEQVKVVSLSRNFGYQISMSAGIEYASGDAIIIIDADLQDPPSMILEFIDKWKDGYDVVFGVREKREGSWLLKMFYKMFYKILRGTSDVDIPLYASEFGLMSRRVADHVINMPEKIRFIRGLRAWVGYKQIGIPYTRGKRTKGHSKFGLFGNVSLGIDAILSFSTRLLTFASLIGLATTVVSTFLIIYILLLKAVKDVETPGYAAIMVSIAFFSGIIILMLGISGAFIERIFLEVKSRPHYLVKETFGIARGEH